MTRIIAGEAKGRRLEVPGRGTRPTSDKVRGAIFSRLEAWGVVEGAEALDLFAGSGALALEALSRGASRAVLVEKVPAAAKVARANVANLGMRGRAKVIVSDCAAFLRSERDAWDLVFADPPYALKEEGVTEVLQLLAPHLDQEATVVLERDARSPEPELPEALELISSKRWGDTAAWFLRMSGSAT